MYNNRSKGFTLIELLVVIAIIGILSAVVLASLNTARQKGNDAAIQSNLNTVQTQAEIYYGADHSGTTNTYNPTSTAISGSGTACTGAMFSETTIANALAQAESANGSNDVNCGVDANGTKYAVWSKLSTNDYWCVDSTGYSGDYGSTAPTGPDSCS